MKSYVKDPDATLDYAFDWSLWLDSGDTIQTSVWTADPALTLTNESNDGTKTKVFVSGGVNESTYKLTNRITTAQGRIDDRSVEIRIYQR